MVLDRNTSPYYDDYDEDKKYNQILFRPGQAVQARELSQLQSIMQNQVDRFGKHIFKEGSQVIPGDIGIDNGIPFARLADQFAATDIIVSNFLAQKIIGTTSGAVAFVLDTEDKVLTDPNTLFLNYETGVSTTDFTGDITTSSANIINVSVAALTELVIGGVITGTGIPANTYIQSITDDNTIIVSNVATATTASLAINQVTADAFVDGETIITSDGVHSAIVEGDSNGVAVGSSSRVSIQRGVYFAIGRFLLVDAQTLILEKYSNNASYKVGLRVIDDFISDADDISLVDPATGTPNFNAPGAHRYKVDLILSKYDLAETTPENFIELLRIDSGRIQKLVTAPDYSELEKTLARRTNDESGNYVVRNFPLQMREHLDDGSNFGVYSSSNGGLETKLALALEPGKCYVKGFEIETAATTFLETEKARTTATENNAIVPFTLGNYVEIDNIKGSFDISTYENVDLLDAQKADTIFPGSVIGTAKVRGLEFISGTPGTVTAKYKLFLFDIVMDTDTSGTPFLFSSVKAIANTGQVVDCDTFLNASLDATLIDTGVNNSALMILPDTAINTLTDVNYTVKRYDSGVMTTTTLTLTGDTNEIYSAGSVTNYHVSIITASGTATGNGFVDGDVIDMSGGGNSITLSGAPTGRQVILTIPDISGSTIAVISTVTKSTETQKTKTLATQAETLAHTGTIQLTKADVYALTSIIDAGTLEDITDRYILDNGQRDNFYDRGTLTFRTEYAAPAGNVNITYDYFNHGAGDYFSVDSYSGVITYTDIPTYISPSTGETYDLRNVVDFRPRINDAGTGFSVVSEIVANTEQLTGDYDYYISRIDKLVVGANGNFTVVTGIPAKAPIAPTAPEETMVLYESFIPAYTFKTSDVVLKKIDNKRYTMHDIGRLEKRIENIEYYSSLNLLEKDTADLFIDDGTGLNRFKSGFLVDNFTSHIIGDVGLLEYSCAIDKENGILRPSFVSNSVPVTLSAVDSSGYQQTGDIITLPYTTESLINQDFASKTENINPYNIFNWVGSISMTPPGDEWYETTQAPDRIITTDDGLADGLAELSGQAIWNDWQTSWLGTPVTTSTARRDVRDNGRIIRETTRVTAQTQGQTRTGIQFNVQNTTTTQSLGERVIDTQVIPWIRENSVAFDCKSLKPNTEIYPFFDNVNVGAFVAPTGGSNGDPLISNISGEISGTFSLPNTTAIRFRTGERLFKLADSSTNDVNFVTTSATATYSAKGILETKENTILSTRSAQIVTTDITDSRVIVGTNVQTSREFARWVDPLAQTFLIDNDGGAFISKIDIFFATKDSGGVPVTLQIRNVVNGYPGQFIVPFSETTLNPSSVNVSTDGSTPTSFVFDSPVYLQDGEEYCFVLLANSIDYNIWVSRIGEFDVISGERISEQPYAGVMFKSQNASTWTADQEQDIKFNIHRCVFTTGSTGTLLFKNDVLPSKILPQDPALTTNASTTVIINMASHGLQNGESTTLVGFATDVNGIPFTELNGTHVITYVNFDSFSITSTTTATSTGIGGGTSVSALNNIRADVINPHIETVALSETSLGWAAKVADTANTLHSTFQPVITKANTEFTDERFIFNTDNELAAKSLHLQAQISSTNDALSPVIDTQRSSVIAVTNRINNVSTNELLPASGDSIARYITKKISLDSPAIGIRAYLAAIRSPVADIKVYIKYLKDSESENIFDDESYEELTATVYPSGSETTFQDYTFELDTIEPFSTYAIKIVMTSLETSDVPLIKDFRTIALGT